MDAVARNFALNQFTLDVPMATMLFGVGHNQKSMVRHSFMSVDNTSCFCPPKTFSNRTRRWSNPAPFRLQPRILALAVPTIGMSAFGEKQTFPDPITNLPM